MVPLLQMIIRFVVALGLGALIGVERESVGKDAGIRTSMLVSGGACLFSLVALSLPYLVSVSDENLSEVIARNSGFMGVISNVVVGIGFIGAGLVFRSGSHVRGLTTAAVVWITSAIGILVGVGMIEFAVVATILTAAVLYLLRKVDLRQELMNKQKEKDGE